MTQKYWEKYKVDLPIGRNGRWVIERFEVTKESPGYMYFIVKGRGIDPGVYTRLVRYKDTESTPEPQERGSDHIHGAIVMSDTPAEISDHYEAIRMADIKGGRILIHGLGMGMFLRACLMSEKVTHVDVVEIDQDLIDLVSPHYQDQRVNIVQGDAFSYKWPVGTKWDIVWHDIWDTLNPDNLEEMAKLHRKFGSRTNWQGSWGKELLLDYR